MDTMLEEQAHVIVALCKDRYTPTLPPQPPPLLQAPCNPLQPPSGFNQHQ